MWLKLRMNNTNKLHTHKVGHPTGAGPSFTDPSLGCISDHKIDLIEKSIGPPRSAKKLPV